MRSALAAFEAPGPAVKKNTCVAAAKAMTTSTPATASTLSRFRRRCWCACTLWRAVNRLSRLPGLARLPLLVLA